MNNSEQKPRTLGRGEVTGYDAWRLAGPPEPNVFAHDFVRGYEIWPLNQIECDCDFSGDDAGNVALNSITILGRVFTASECAEWLGQSEIDRLTEAAQEWWSDEGMAEAARDYDDGRADDARDFAMED